MILLACSLSGEHTDVCTVSPGEAHFRELWKKLAAFVAKCLEAAGYDSLEVVSEMNTTLQNTDNEPLCHYL